MNKKWQQKLKEQFDNNPVETIAVGALALTALAKVIDAWSSRQSRAAYAHYAYRPK